MVKHHETKYHCEQCDVPMPCRGNRSRVKMKEKRGKLLCKDCSRLLNFARINLGKKYGET